MGPGNDVNAYQDVIVRCQEKENIPSKSGLMGVYPRQTSVNVKYSSMGDVSTGKWTVYRVDSGTALPS
jgi:hypothetical protein